MKKIAYSGIEGCFAHIVARKLFPDELHVSFAGFEQAYGSVVSGQCDIAVLPVKNSYAGPVNEVQKLIEDGGLYINDTYELPVVQNLLGIRGARLGDIRTVISQQKAIEQCDSYIREHGYDVVISTNTAVAAKEVISRHNMSIAAIAGLETAAQYGLRVLAEKINEKDDNITTFVTVSREQKTV